MPRPRIVDPQPFDRPQLKVLYQERLADYEEQLLQLYRRVRTLLEEQGFTPTIKHRVKRFNAYADKLGKLHNRRDDESQAITDLFGLRIICPFLEDIERIEGLITSHFDVLEIVRKGSQNSFREFGYDSLHLIIQLDTRELGALLPGVEATCEIQLRTILQDAWAEVEHELIYKSDLTFPNQSIRRKLASLNATLTLSDLIFQEIRDFQKGLRQRGNQRRESVHAGLPASDQIRIEAPVTPEAPLTTPAFSAPAMGSDLEKLMLEALDIHSRRDFSSAVLLYNRLITMKLDPQLRALIYNHRGMALFALGEYRQALHDFTRATRFAPDYIRSYTNRGLCNRVLHRYQQSLADYDAALRLDPACGDSLFGRAQTYYALRLYTQALEDCERVLQNDPGRRPAQELRQAIRREIF